MRLYCLTSTPFFARPLLENDTPQLAGCAVMIRLGMQYLRAVDYPLGAGVEYILRHDDPKPKPLPEALLWHD